MIDLSKYLIYLICFMSSTLLALQVVDDQGERIQLTHPAKRIISLAPDLTEIVYAIGSGAQVVGVIKGSDFPPEVVKVPIVGSYAGVDVEKMLALHPDLIVVWSHTFEKSLLILKSIGIPIYHAEPHRLEDVPRTMKNLGVLTGLTLSANKMAESYMYDLVALFEHFHDQKPLRVFYQLGSYGLMTVNKESWINQVIRLCGGINVFAEANNTTPDVNYEALMMANPEVIITDATRPNWQDRWRHLPQLMAVKQGAFLNVSPDLIDRAGPRLLHGARQVCEYLSVIRQSSLKSASING